MSRSPIAEPPPPLCGRGCHSGLVGANEQVMTDVWTRRLSDAELRAVAQVARLAASQIGVTF